MENQIEDPVFGTLISDEQPVYRDGSVCWNGKDTIDLVGGSVRLSIYTDPGTGPTEGQRQRYLAFKSSPAALKAHLQEPLFEFYKVEREAYLEVIGVPFFDDEYVAECLPVLTNAEDIWPLLEPDAFLSIEGPSSRRQCDMELCLHGCWDIEHEFIVQLKENRVLDIVNIGNYDPEH